MNTFRPVDESKSEKDLDLLRQEIAALEQEILALNDESQRRDQTYPVLQQKIAAIDYGKSEYEYLSTRPHYISAMYYRLQMFWRNFSLLREIHGMPERHVPPPRALPKDVLHPFSMDGQIPVIDAFFAAKYARHFEAVLAEDELETFLEALNGAPRERRSLAPRLLLEYRRAANALLHPEGGDPTHQAIDHYVNANVSVATYGSITPLYEALCLHRGASPVAIGSGPIRSESPRITALNYTDAIRSGRKFDRVLAPLIVHRAGLGLLDDIDPDGDLALLAKLRELLTPDGLILLTLPVGPDLVLYNSARVYGPVRLPVLLRGWNCVASFGVQHQQPLPDKSTLGTFVLQPVGPSATTTQNP